MTQHSPTPNEWQILVEAALAFRAMEPWKWLSSDMLWGVQNPETGEIGCCTIMGNLGEVFALALYPGPEGYHTFDIVSSGEVGQDSLDMMNVQLCYLAEFENKSRLTNEDLTILQQLKITPKGRKAWPLFREYKPGFAPWYITSKHARFLTVALRQSMLFAERVLDDPSLLVPPSPEHLFVRTSRREHDNVVWKDSWDVVPLFEPKEFIVAIPTKSELSGIQKLRLTSAAWEIDYFYSPIPIQPTKKERPYYPYLFVAVDAQSGFIFRFHLTDLICNSDEFLTQLVVLFKTARCLPKRIFVKREDVYEFLKPVADMLGITVSITDELPRLEEALEEMYQFMSR